MKKILSIITCALSVMTIASCDWFVLDNQEGYNASVYGTFVDSKTGEPVYQEQGGAFTIYEKASGGQAYIGRDWDNEVSQSWTAKSNGTYVNRLVFAGDYYMESNAANFVADAQDFTLKKGENKVDFQVTPYVRIKDVNITVSGDKIKATCKVESDLPDSQVNNIGEVRLCCFTDRFVSNSQNNCTKDAGALFQNAKTDGSQTISLEIDMKAAANAYEFQYKRAHYVRIAAIGAHYAIVPLYEQQIDWENSPYAQWGYYTYKQVYIGDGYANDGKSNTSNKYNYSAVFKIDENGTVTEVTDWGDVK